MSRLLTLGLLCAAAVALPFASASAQTRTSAAAATRTVKIADIAFKPPVVTVRKGATVRWQFKDGLTFHNVHSTGKRRFKSSNDRKQGTYSVRFSRAGTYRYMCTLHPLSMKGKVVVR